MPLRSEADEQAGPGLIDVNQAGPFEAGDYDTFEVVLRELHARRRCSCTCGSG